MKNKIQKIETFLAWRTSPKIPVLKHKMFNVFRVKFIHFKPKEK